MYVKNIIVWNDPLADQVSVWSRAIVYMFDYVTYKAFMTYLDEGITNDTPQRAGPLFWDDWHLLFKLHLLDKKGQSV